MSTKKKSNPFAYFGDDIDEDELSSSDEEGEKKEENDGEKSQDPLSYITKSDDKAESKELPKADEVLTKRHEPEFLKEKDTGAVNWDKLVKNDIDEEEEPAKTTNAMPPPKSYDQVTDKLGPTLGDLGDEKSQKRSFDSDDSGSKKLKT